MMKRLLLHLRSAFFRWNLLIMVVVALAAGFAIVLHGRTEKFPAILRIPGLYSSALYSAIIAFILLLVIYVVSFTGNAKYAGREMNGRWLLYQLKYGVLLTLFVELILATILFGLHGFWILDTAFFDKVILPVFLFVLLANVSYLFFYTQRVRYEVEVPIEVPVEVLVEVPVEVRVEVPVIVETVRYQAVPLAIATEKEKLEQSLAADEPALFYTYNGEVWKKDFGGKRSIWLKSLTATMAELDHELYFKSARNWIVHRNAVASITPLPGRQIEISCIFKVRIELVVPRRTAHKFKEWLYGGEEPSDDGAVHF